MHNRFEGQDPASLQAWTRIIRHESPNGALTLQFDVDVAGLCSRAPALEEIRRRDGTMAQAQKTVHTSGVGS